MEAECNLLLLTENSGARISELEEEVKVVGNVVTSVVYSD